MTEAVQHHHEVSFAGEIVLDPTMAVAVANRLAHAVDSRILLTGFERATSEDPSIMCHLRRSELGVTT